LKKYESLAPQSIVTPESKTTIANVSDLSSEKTKVESSKKCSKPELVKMEAVSSNVTFAAPAKPSAYTEPSKTLSSLSSPEGELPINSSEKIPPLTISATELRIDSLTINNFYYYPGSQEAKKENQLTSTKAAEKSSNKKQKLDDDLTNLDQIHSTYEGWISKNFEIYQNYQSLWNQQPSLEKIFSSLSSIYKVWERSCVQQRQLFLLQQDFISSYIKKAVSIEDKEAISRIEEKLNDINSLKSKWEFFQEKQSNFSLELEQRTEQKLKELEEVKIESKDEKALSNKKVKRKSTYSEIPEVKYTQPLIIKARKGSIPKQRSANI
jgi:hypothetical protein